MPKLSTYLFWIIVACIVAIVVTQLFSTSDTTNFYKAIDTIIKVALGAWGGASASEWYQKPENKNEGS